MKTGTSKRNRVISSAEWIAYFHDNANQQRRIEWESGVVLSEQELHHLIPSLRGWQLGETSDGWHLRAAALRYAAKYDDPTFVDAAALFTAEEQRHGESLGRFLDLAKVPRARFDWGDAAFKSLHYCWPAMEIWVTPVLMAETLAMVYYGAIRRATDSVVLEQICKQMIRDEVAHLRFQCERLAILHRARSAPLRALTLAAQAIFFTGVVLAVWVGHGKALRYCGLGFRSYWAQSWRRMRGAWRRMNPHRYHWAECATLATPRIHMATAE